MRIFFPFLTITLLLYTIQSFPQISPGDLAAPHAHLEGMSNCTQCHILGAKVSNEKCLKCHTEIKERLDQNKGYHSSDPVKAKECVVCHNDHHGRNFKIILFSEDHFDHNLTGYKLEGAYNELNCNECHKNEFINSPKLKAKKSTYLGLNPSCLTCHNDYHQNTLSTNCTDCHHFDNFKPAPKFNHNNSRYRLKGKHQDVTCVKCHKLKIHNGKPFQEFKGISFGNCNSCHADVHQNQFGQDCRQCHQEESFQHIKGLSNFDHNKTNFRLEGRHQTVNCKSCHKSKLTDPLKHKLCNDCHTDYHQGQFSESGSSPDCSECHNTMGFSGSTFTIEKHNSGLFPLEGAHFATPCIACHKKKDRWNFRKIGFDCKDCHPDIHQPYLDKKYYPDENCKNCHTVNRWDEVTFDHSRTNFDLAGAHSNQACRKCHFIRSADGTDHHKFSGLSSLCVNCHQDIHYRQFDKSGITDCIRCHQFDNWKAEKFDHNKTRFILDGKHANVACHQCHKVIQEGQTTFTQYKFNDFKCETCHL